MDSYKIDVTGDDILSKNAGVIVTYNNKRVYAFKFSCDVQKNIRENYQQGNYCLNSKKILKPRVYCAVLAIILRRIAQENYTEQKNYQLNICKDFDGHEVNIISILKEHTNQLNIFEELDANNYSFCRHPKKSLIQQSAQKIYHSNWEEISRVNIEEKELHYLIAKPKCRKKKWR